MTRKIIANSLVIFRDAGRRVSGKTGSEREMVNWM
jgi:hypothetical protein